MYVRRVNERHRLRVMPSVVKAVSLVQALLVLQVAVLSHPEERIHSQDDPAHHTLQLHDGAYGELCGLAQNGFSSKKHLQVQEIVSDMPAHAADSFIPTYTPPSRDGILLFPSFLLRTLSTSSDL
jgi:hypothetical protein